MCHCFHTLDRRKNKGGCGQRTLWFALRLSFASRQTSIAPYSCYSQSIQSRSELLWGDTVRYTIRIPVKFFRLTHARRFILIKTLKRFDIIYLDAGSWLNENGDARQRSRLSKEHLNKACTVHNKIPCNGLFLVLETLMKE